MAEDLDVLIEMVKILSTLGFLLVGLWTVQTTSEHQVSSFLPNPNQQPSKYSYERYVWIYTPFWITSFMVIVAFELYENFTAWTYDIVLAALCTPLWLQPLVYPLGPDRAKPFAQRYALKANVWIAMFSFIGNYWYTHYFYCVLRAKYTMPSHDLNGVPIAMYFATHFYFSTYHALSNGLLRKVRTTYEPGVLRTLFFVAVILALSYVTAFMETFTISKFPYWTFENRAMAYTIGSTFYGIYFIVSFPMFYFFDNGVEELGKDETPISSSVTTLWDTVVHSAGCGMLVLCLLDFVRLSLNIPLVLD